MRGGEGAEEHWDRDSGDGGHRLAPTSRKGLRPFGAASLAHNLGSCCCCPKKCGALLLMAPTSQQRWGGGTRAPPLQSGRGFPVSGCNWKTHLGWTHTHTAGVGCFASRSSPRGPRDAVYPHKLEGGEGPGWGEGPAGAAGETELRSGGGVLPSRRAGLCPQQQLRLLGAVGSFAVRLWGEPQGEGKQPGLSSSPLPGGQKCPFR